MGKLSHLDDQGQAHMVDVSGKPETTRQARASARVLLAPETLTVLTDGSSPKGDVIATARIAGIMAAKRCSDLIPLCHPLPIKKVTIDFESDDEGITISSLVKTAGQTGVEMEALTAASVAALTIYDMLKAVEKSITITDIHLVEKTGGKSGTYRAS